jgi:argininosuccinate lyase
MKLWSGRFSGSLDTLAAQLNNSLPFDQRLALQDVQGSLAWAKAIAQAGIISPEEASTLQHGLTAIQEEFKNESFVFQESDEDIHTAVERRLGELVGVTAGKLHTGRSRNDQVATDFRLWLVQAIPLLETQLKHLQQVLIDRAEQDLGIAIPGYTHFQQAQPVLLSHWWLSHFWALQRDRQRLNQVLQNTLSSPLGCGALAGTGFNIDRFALAADLGLGAPTPNSLDAISDRDFAAEFLFWASLTGIHLSRLAEALILYSTREFGFMIMDDAFSTGSSLMPQKKNADPMELTRAKSGFLTGRLMGLLATLKGLPSAYDKDLQEDKQPVFDAFDTLDVLLPVVGGTIATLKVNQERCQAAIGWEMISTDLADYLVHHGVPFREAHSAVGKMVKRAEQANLPLPQLPLEIWQSVHPAFGPDLFDLFNVERSLAQHAAWGGTAPAAVQAQLNFAKQTLEQV